MPHYIAAEPTFSTGLRPEGIEKSPYFWWWRFLGLNERYIETCKSSGDGPLAELYEDFGDVRVADGNVYQSFKKWWGVKGENHGQLFQERSLFPKAKTLTAKDDFSPVMSEYPYAVVVVDVHLGVKKAQEMVGAAIKEIQHYRQLPLRDAVIDDNAIAPENGKLQKPEGRVSLLRRYSTSRYRLTALVEKNELSKAYRVYCAVKEAGFHTTDKMTDQEKVSVAESCALLEKVDPRRGLTKSEREARYEVASSELKKYFDDASRYVRNTGYGHFPEMPPDVFTEWDNHTNALTKIGGRNFEPM